MENLENGPPAFSGTPPPSSSTPPPPSPSMASGGDPHGTFEVHPDEDDEDGTFYMRYEHDEF